MTLNRLTAAASAMAAGDMGRPSPPALDPLRTQQQSHDAPGQSAGMREVSMCGSKTRTATDTAMKMN